MVLGENKFKVEPQWKLGSDVIQNVEELEILGVRSEIIFVENHAPTCFIVWNWLY